MPVWRRDERTDAQVRHGPPWNPILGWSRGRDRLRAQPRGPAARGLHDLRVDQGVVRVLHHGLGHDLRASAACADNVAIYRRWWNWKPGPRSRSRAHAGWAMWHLTCLMRRCWRGCSWPGARRRAAGRRACLPADLLFTKGWPTAIPLDGRGSTHCQRAQARGRGRRAGGHAHGRAAVLARYAQLLSGAPSG